MTAPAAAPGATAAPARVARLSYFFPAHNEEANLEGLVQEALETLPSIAETFEIIAVNDGSRDRTREIADRLAAEHPGVVRAVHHDVNRGYGGALRSGFEASRYELLAFTDGDRQFRVADIARLTARLAAADRPDVVVGLPDQARRPDHPDRLRADVQARQPDLLRPPGPRRGLRLQAVPPRGARGRPGRVRRRLLLRGAAGQDRGAGPLDRRGRRPALRAHRRLADGRRAVGHRAGGEGLLDAAPAPLGERGPGPAPGPADPGRASRRRAGPAAAAGIAAIRLEAVHELAEDVELRGVEALAGRLERARGQPAPACVPGLLASGRPLLALVVVVLVVVGQRRGLVQHLRRRRRSGTRAGPRARSRPRAARPPRGGCPRSTSSRRAWNVSSASDAMTTRSMRTPSSASVATNRSWVSGRSAAIPCRRIAIAWASQGPIQTGQDPAGPDLLEQEHVAPGPHVDADALDDHLDLGGAVAGHGADYPTHGPPRGPSRWRGTGRGARQRTAGGGGARRGRVGRRDGRRRHPRDRAPDAGAPAPRR